MRELIARIRGSRLMLGALVGIVGGLIVAVLLVVVVGVGRSSTRVEATGPAKTATKKAAEGASRFGPSFVVRDRIVNLADPGGRRYLRFTVAVEFEGCAEAAAGPGAATTQLALYVPAVDAPSYRLTTGGARDTDKEFQAQIRKYAPAIEDVVTVVLSSKTYAEVQSVEGKESAKSEIKDRINQMLQREASPSSGTACVMAYPPRVTNVYFNEFVIQ
ncbi:MAG TPA: flagellar basal body-associated FliL family protein [Chloroflexota bacterium]|jgi:flagellar FliL protein|nr:flagellar basal body-associated FliL family protein [Chloroflexota bacterium]